MSRTFVHYSKFFKINIYTIYDFDCLQKQVNMLDILIGYFERNEKKEKNMHKYNIQKITKSKLDAIVRRKFINYIE